jgi:hypothetical protein
MLSRVMFSAVFNNYRLLCEIMWWAQVTEVIAHVNSFPSNCSHARLKQFYSSVGICYRSVVKTE